ncbi:uncharacterized protein ACO6RY_07983 [Pungitius sinensis]
MQNLPGADPTILGFSLLSE